MGFKPNEGMGTEVEEDVLVYKQTDTNGHTVYARCLGWVNDTVKGLRHAWVLHPRFGMEEMSPREGRLEGFTAVRVVLRRRRAAVHDSRRPLVLRWHRDTASGYGHDQDAGPVASLCL